MTSYLSYKRQMRVLDEQDPDIVGWFTTENGVHIPLRKGQSKKDATEAFFASKKGETQPVTSENHYADGLRHFSNLIEYPKRQMRELYSHLMYALPPKLKNGEEWTMNLKTMETPEDFEKFHNDIKKRYESGEFEHNEWAAGNMKRYLEQSEPLIQKVKGYTKSYHDIEERFEPKTGENIDSEGSPIANVEEVKKKLEGSKAVDPNGNPVAVYIGTREPVTGNKFDFKHRREDSVSKQRAIFLTTKREVAETYQDGEGEVKKAYLNMKRPLVVDFNGSTFHNGGYEEFVVHPYEEPWNTTTIQRKSHFADAAEAPVINKLVNYAKKNGYDGLIAKNIVDWGTYRSHEGDFDPYDTMWFHNDDYVVFDPEQIVVVPEKKTVKTPKLKDGAKYVDYGNTPEGKEYINKIIGMGFEDTPEKRKLNEEYQKKRSEAQEQFAAQSIENPIDMKKYYTSERDFDRGWKADILKPTGVGVGGYKFQPLQSGNPHDERGLADLDPNDNLVELTEHQAKELFAKNFPGETFGGLSHSDEELLRRYTHMTPENSHLRKGEVTESAKKMKDIIGRTFTKSEQVYRGVPNLPEISSLKEGDIYIDKGFMSTSSYKDVAEKFKKDGYMLSIKTAPGYGNRISVSYLSEKPEESESILQAGSMFDVKKVNHETKEIELVQR